jgi:hypothetical protein
METETTRSLLRIFDTMPQILLFGIGLILLVLATFYLAKITFWYRRNTSLTSYQQDVVAPVQYGDRGAEPPADAFVERLEDMVEQEEAYDLARLLPNARELGAIAKTGFHIAPVLTPEDTRVLALIEDVLREVPGGYRVLLRTSLETLVDLDDTSASKAATRLSMAGITLKFAVVDRYGKLVMAVEHLCDKKLNRQACINRTVVVEVLRKAGVWYLEIPPNYSSKDARAQMVAVLQGADLGQHTGVNVA